MPSTAIKIKNMKEAFKEYLAKKCGWGGSLTLDGLTVPASESAFIALADAAIEHSLKILLIAQGTALEKNVAIIESYDIAEAIAKVKNH